MDCRSSSRGDTPPVGDGPGKFAVVASSPPQLAQLGEAWGRGQAEGVFDDQLSAEWIQQVLWSVTYTAFEQVAQGSLAKFDVAATVTRTLERGITVHNGDAA